MPVREVQESTGHEMKTPIEPVARTKYVDLLGHLTGLLEQARHSAARSINAILTMTYWEVGRRIVKFEQGGADRAAYGQTLLKHLSGDLSMKFGRGFSEENLRLMRLFYLSYGQRISQTLSGKSQKQFPLPWSHYVRLLAIDDPRKRDFYEKEAQKGGWSVRQLDRQINAMLYERLALSRQKEKSSLKADQHAASATPEQEIKDPYLLEFLGLPDLPSEKDLENALIRHLAEFLLELGYGFTFVARQKRLQIGSESYYLDLLCSASK